MISGTVFRSFFLFAILFAILSVIAPKKILGAIETNYEVAGKLAEVPSPFKVTKSGKIAADKNNWKVEKDPEGSEVYTFKGKNESKVAALYSDGKSGKAKENGTLEALISYRMVDKAKTASANASVKPSTDTLESSSGIFFASGKLAAHTQCEETEDIKELGRICVTATPRLCSDLKKGETIEPETIKEIDLFEMRSLASILTLRGSEHQLENVVRYGNRLGLKSALQTTKGQLIALARQVAKESVQTKSNVPKNAQAADGIAEKMKLDSKLARNVLEKTLPRLKESCAAF